MSSALAIMRGAAGQSSHRTNLNMTLKAHISTLETLPDVVARLTAIRNAADELAEIEYAGADVLVSERDTALEALDGVPGALRYHSGLRHAKGDAAAFERWDGGVAARMRVGDLQ